MPCNRSFEKEVGCPKTYDGQEEFPWPAHWRGAGGDDVFCPESISGHRTTLECVLLGAAREQSPHAAEMILIANADKLGPGLDRSDP